MVTLKTASAENVVRPVAKIALLPLPNDPNFEGSINPEDLDQVGPK